MKYLVQVCLIAAIFCACKSSTSSPPVSDSTVVAVSNQADSLIGLYKGDFDGKKIYITINYAKNNHLAGYNVLNGLRRNVSGSYKIVDNGFDVTLSEPGDHPYDGKFTIHFSVNDRKGNGKWTPLNNSSLKAKTFDLAKVSLTGGNGISFEYDYPLAGDHRDILFAKDGSCTLNYYEMHSDSTFAQQMITVRGNWEQKGDSVLVTWEKRNDITLPATIYSIQFEGEGDERFLTGVESTDSIRYWTGP